MPRNKGSYARSIDSGTLLDALSGSGSAPIATYRAWLTVLRVLRSAAEWDTMDTSLAIGASGGFPWLSLAYCSPGYRVAMDEPGNSPST